MGKFVRDLYQNNNINHYIHNDKIRVRDLSPKSLFNRIKHKVRSIKYGFDIRESWELDESMVELLYDRIMIYKQDASEIVDLDYHTFDIDGKTYTQIEAIDELINLCEKYLLDYDLFGDNHEEGEKIWLIWSIIFPSMWW